MISGKKTHDLSESGGQAECNIWCYATLGERDRDMFEIDHSLLYLAEFFPPKTTLCLLTKFRLMLFTTVLFS